MDNGINEIVDISSVSDEAKQKKKNFIKSIKLPTIKATGFKSLGNIIKIISFVVAFAIFAVFVLAAYLLFAFRPLYLTLSVAIIVLGIIVALIVLFMIYAIGHIVNQNNEIIDLLNIKEDEE